MGQYDITLRDLTRTGGHAFLRTVGGEGLLTLMQTDFPEPVLPAIRMWGMSAISAMTGCP